MGLGAFGGGEGAVRFLAERGALVTVTDIKLREALRPAVERVASLSGVTLRLGEHKEMDFTQAGLLVVNPAVRRDNAFLQQAIAAGVPLTSEMNLFWMRHRGRAIGVTGSNGKSTTATLIHHMLAAAGIRSRIGGNIGVSLLPEVENILPGDWTVLELSSFQLADLAHLRASPEIAVITNFSPNHQDRHDSVEEYRTAKQAILRWQRADHLAVLNADDPDVATWETAGRVLAYGEASSSDARVVANSKCVIGDAAGGQWSVCVPDSLPGRHNRLNVAAAALAAHAAGADPRAIQVAVDQFRGLPHRLEFVDEYDGRRFYNDSKSTTPEAAVAALEAFDHRSGIVLLAGGADKHVDLSRMAAAIRRRVRAVALLGETAAELARLLAAVDDSSAVPAMYCARSLEDSFQWAVSQSAPGDVVLLSPGCASLDWFANYEDRGRQFVELVRRVLRDEG